jgi:hypothetical protein
VGAEGHPGCAADREDVVTGDLVERLRHALDAHEVVMRQATPGPWTIEPNRSVRAGDDLVVASVTARDLWPSARDASFIAVNDPAHVLRTIQAHRKIVGRHERGVFHPDECGRCNDPFPCPDVRSIAAIYLPDIETGDTPNA